MIEANVKIHPFRDLHQAPMNAVSPSTHFRVCLNPIGLRGCQHPSDYSGSAFDQNLGKPRFSTELCFLYRVHAAYGKLLLSLVRKKKKFAMCEKR